MLPDIGIGLFLSFITKNNSIIIFLLLVILYIYAKISLGWVPRGEIVPWNLVIFNFILYYHMFSNVIVSVYTLIMSI